MNSSVGEPDLKSLAKLHSPVGYGLAIIQHDQKLRYGLWSEHTGSNRQHHQFFDVKVVFGEDQNKCSNHVIRRAAIRIEDFPAGIDIMIGEYYWNRCSESSEHSQPPRDSIQTSSWNQCPLKIPSTWHVTLGWPVATDGHPGSVLTPHKALSRWRVGILAKSDSCCIVNRKSLMKSTEGIVYPPFLHHDEAYTYYFPGV